MNSSATLDAGVNCRILRLAEEFRRIVPEWKQLFAQCPDATPFQSPDWLMAWIEAFQPNHLLGVEVRERGRLIGFAPLLIYPLGCNRVLAFAGGGASDYLGLVAEVGQELRVLDSMLVAIQNVRGWDVLDLTDIRSGSSLLRPDFLRAHAREHDLCFVLSLPATTEQLHENLSKRQWATLRNARSRTHREGESTVEMATLQQVPEFLSDLFQLHAKRWAALGEGGMLQDERVRTFHRTAAPALFAAKMLRLYRMRVGGRSAAVIYCLFHRQCAFCYLQGFDPEFSHLSPGTQLMFSVIEDAVRQGMTTFDFLRGTEAYKIHWKPVGRPTFRIEMPMQRFSALPLSA